MGTPASTIGLDPRQGGTSNRQAYDLLLVASANDQPNPSVLTGLRQIDRALEIDPEFALAWARKAALHNMETALLTRRPGADRAAEDAARRALELEPNLGPAHVALAGALGARGEWVQANAAYEKGLALGAETGASYGIFLLSVGYIERARQHLSAVRDSNPLDGMTAAYLAAAYDSLGDPGRALAEYERGRTLYSAWGAGAFDEALTLLGVENFDINSWLGAERDAGSGVTQWPDPVMERAIMRTMQIVAHLDEPDVAVAELRAFDAEQPLAFFRIVLSAVAARVGEQALAFEILSDTLGSSTATLSQAMWRPVFRDVRQLPEFEPWLREQGFVAFWQAHGWPDLCRPLGDRELSCR